MSSNFNEEDDETWLYGAEGNEPHEMETQQLIKPTTETIDKVNLINDSFIEEDQVAKSHDHEINYDVDPSLHTESQESMAESEMPDNAVVMQENEVKGDSEEEEEEVGGDEDEDDDDEDNININIVISDIVNKPYSAQQTGDPAAFNRQKSHQLTTQVVPGAVQATNAAVAKVPAKGVDLDAPGLINEQPTFEYDLQEVKDEDKPWRMPGADITDYFNYGFTEETWIQYCMKQKRLRAENSGYKVLFLGFTCKVGYF
jgi:pre-mRNA 3'-end-processing factor FIP1